ncbi:iron-containing alcohol dehydrogenase family protein [Natronorubrum bangense]|uniref:Iron-containing alcohol dehydrogenase n=2 Tax=Natronorubrum bangense TaxID=61858 RepID=A0A4D6HIZ4_9EURY|nr:iron-containing alcohol dehydrogenase family protein [Natronorubrum bangense]ELY43561.1 iron-containing alcohol dehydrogenase [Natronorubrum bangense JCM 10635]QCC53156.1 iron-containing alcohol dehydrogenase [Natronorubrum bangense]QCC56152.1 iron-containing alcohol dehydrogenase [Natronorubrum bangense]
MTHSPSRARDAAFRFEYEPATIRFGSGCVDALEAELERQSLERALIVCGSTVGSTPDVIDPITAGLGDRLAGVFAETTSKKRLGTAVDGLERLEDEDVDVLVSLGGGSSLDVAKVISVLAASDREPAAIGDEFAETGTITVPNEGLVPIVAVPTTLAGADLSQVAGVTAAPESGLVETEVGGGISGPGLMPAAAVYDPDIVATTPESILTGSAMNGFDKGLEAIYAANATPVTDATAMRGLGKLETGLRAFGRGVRDTETFATILEGIVLVQYGISRPDETMLSIVHAFGHGLTRTDDVQQGTAHAVVVPHVLAYLFDQVDARVDVLADALGVADADDPARAVVDRVADVRDALELPTRLRDVDGPEPDEFTAVAEAILADSFMANAPPGLEASVEDIERILEQAW